MTPLPAELKTAAEDAFHGSSPRAAIPPEGRELAARWHEDQAARTVGA